MTGWLALSLWVCPVFGSEGGSASPKRLLLLTHAALYKHASLGPAEDAVTEWGLEAGYVVTSLEGFRQDRGALDLSMIDAAFLAQFDGIFFMTNGNLPMTEEQKAALVDFVKEGGGFVGVHCASLTFYDYPPFGEMLGGYFRRPVGQNRRVVLEVEDRTHPSTRALGGSWPLVDEFYIFGNDTWSSERPEENLDELFGHRIPLAFSRDRVHVLLRLSTAESDLSQFEGLEEEGDYPQAWWRLFGDGRSFYTALGHRPELWTSDPVFRAHIVGGIRWALGLEDVKP